MQFLLVILGVQVHNYTSYWKKKVLIIKIYYKKRSKGLILIAQNVPYTFPHGIIEGVFSRILIAKISNMCT